ncbi:hypothetical protein [Geminocystis sp. CENA526]|uniref:hypothetical protein n=1 Tax=Geminocystis sp. CENA526 TaxID=1355871 RepID=UPI003D6E62D7
MMEIINGKLITEPSEESQLWQQKLEEIINQSDQLQLTLTKQNHQIESLKLLVTSLEQKISKVEKEKLIPIQSSLMLLNTRVHRKFLTVTITAIMGFLILGFTIINTDKNENKSNNFSIRELINIAFLNDS